MPLVHLKPGLGAAALADEGDHAVAACVDHVLEFNLPGFPHLRPAADVFRHRIESARDRSVGEVAPIPLDLGIKGAEGRFKVIAKKRLPHVADDFHVLLSHDAGEYPR